MQAGDKHRKLKTIMQDRPDLIESELSGLAFDSLQCCFRPMDIEALFEEEPLVPLLNAEVHIVVDPAGGGPHSDYALVSFQRSRGTVTITGIECLNTKEPSKQFLLLRSTSTSCGAMCTAPTPKSASTWSETWPLRQSIIGTRCGICIMRRFTRTTRPGGWGCSRRTMSSTRRWSSLM